jgi:methyl-accepting chemotaxis protein
MVTDLQQAYEKMTQDISNMCNEAGTSIEEFSETMVGALQQAQKASDETADSIEDMANKGKEAFSNLVTEANSWLTNYESTSESIKSANEIII